jgi:hypothetical protein
LQQAITYLPYFTPKAKPLIFFKHSGWVLRLLRAGFGNLHYGPSLGKNEPVSVIYLFAIFWREISHEKMEMHGMRLHS